MRFNGVKCLHGFTARALPGVCRRPVSLGCSAGPGLFYKEPVFGCEGVGRCSGNAERRGGAGAQCREMLEAFEAGGARPVPEAQRLREPREGWSHSWVPGEGPCPRPQAACPGREDGDLESRPPYQGRQAGRRSSANLRPHPDSVPQPHPGVLARSCTPAGPRAPAMELPSACSHPCWFLLTLLLGLLLWARRRCAWDPRKCPTDLTGKTVIVTGANSGLPFTITPEGLEQTFATNYLGPFLLTNLLLDLLKASAPARIVNVSSFRHSVGTVDSRYLTGQERLRGSDAAYNSTKLMNVLFTAELARRLQGTGVTANALSPGVVSTSIMRHFGWAVRALFTLIRPFIKSAEQGAVSTIYCAVSEEAAGITGKYFDSDCGLALPSMAARDTGLARKLWEESERLTGLTNSPRH
ncbi:uncharacterized protein LOC129206172 isoform X2 [Grus americana]|uniref:uncharacterized protein LOC129206172 isoform X2 n=1 Tax=Grus americana TaxID=9117 RepID=UPI00240780D2|nr:uncharacterized protein LOC129206172 isoform X2 [Grus americana]